MRYEVVIKKMSFMGIEYFVGAIIDLDTRELLYSAKALSERGIKQSLINQVKKAEYAKWKKVSDSEELENKL
jgi:hypothetical protein